MTRIKICALTNLEDALCAVNAGADALGFVFAPKSKRLVDPDLVAKILRQIPQFVTTVGVFQNQPLEEVREIIKTSGIKVAQLHGDEDSGYLDALDFPAYKAFSIATVEDLAALTDFDLQRGFLLDSGTGGTGKTFDWDIAKRAVGLGSLILAGGLGPENVASAIKEVSPFAVDVASGVERSYGVKDHDKIKGFISEVRRADALVKENQDG